MTPAALAPTQKPESFPLKALQSLADRVLDGNVLFFVGSGFSIDSEGNTAARLVRRLLMRLAAMAGALGDEGDGVRTDLMKTFEIAGNQAGEFKYSADEVRRLSDRYYETNDWFCSGFARLLALLARKEGPELALALQTISTLEEKIRKSVDQDGREIDSVAFDPIDPELIEMTKCGQEAERREAGKALFLDTMGFRNLGIMGGQPELARPDDVVHSYGDRLRLRHHVIARLAREGFCTATLTTNYDRLLEGAFRTAGFGYESSENFSPETFIKEFACIASPLEFFTEGKAHRTAVLMKIHGCSRRYCDTKYKERTGLSSYLRSMVFTYREIQNWREDSWAADYLRTVLRTQTVVFCGYSLQDPVIHDTFRTVYEQMARDHRANQTRPVASKQSGGAPAYLFGRDQSPFYGMEILRAASAAIGSTAEPLSTHPNYIRFYVRDEPEFPHLDELFRWLFHTVFRRRQQHCLDTDLCRVSTLLLGKPRPRQELARVREDFENLCRWEKEDLAAHWDSRELSRQQHSAVCSWTDGFHTALLREFACSEELNEQRGPTRKLSWMRRIPWYYPTTGRPDWTCWGAVLEVALRRMIENRLMRDTMKECWLTRGGACSQPTILFSSPESPAIQALTIASGGLDRQGYQARIHVGAVRQIVWNLPSGTPLWPLAPDEKDSARKPAVAPPADSLPYGSAFVQAPDAGVIWRWASRTATRGDEEMLPSILGSTPGREIAKAENLAV
jgi:hypothetical protein